MNSRHLLSMTFAALAIACAGTLPAQAAEETWKDIGEGTLRDDLITKYWNTSEYYEFKVPMQESEQTPGRYRLVNAYKNCPSVGGESIADDITNYIIVDASNPDRVYIENGNASYNYGIAEDKDGKDVPVWLCVWSRAHLSYVKSAKDESKRNWAEAEKEGTFGSLKDGAITFPRFALLITGAYDPKYSANENDLWAAANEHGMFRLKLPSTPETDIDLALQGINEAGTEVNYTVGPGKDVEYLKLALFQGEYTADMRGKVENDEVATQRVDQLSTVSFPFLKDGVYTLVAVPYSGGKSWAPSYITSEWQYSQDEWKNAGSVEFVEAILSSNEMRNYGFVLEPYTYEVPIQQNVSNPARIRLVDPYGPDCYPRASSTNYDTSKHYYLVFDLTYHDLVQIEYAENIGLLMGNVGIISIRSNSDYYMHDSVLGLGNLSMEEYVDRGMPRGYYDPESREVTFDKNGIRIAFSANPTGAWYNANENGTFKMTLPSDLELPEGKIAGGNSGIKVVDTENAPAEYFTLDGVKVSGALTPGMYIVRRGAESRKVMVK